MGLNTSQAEEITSNDEHYSKDRTGKDSRKSLKEALPHLSTGTEGNPGYPVNCQQQDWNPRRLPSLDLNITTVALNPSAGLVLFFYFPNILVVVSKIW